MDNTNHIIIFCYKLTKLWEQYPYLRFGEIISLIKNEENLLSIKDNELLDLIEKKIINYSIEESMKSFGKNFLSMFKNEEK